MRDLGTDHIVVAAWGSKGDWLPVAVFSNYDAKLADHLRKRGYWNELDFAVISFSSAKGRIWKAGEKKAVEL